LHVVDASHPDAEQQITTVNNVLKDLGVEAQEPLLVLNKVDAVEDRSIVDVLRGRHPSSVTISAVDGTGLDRLAQIVADRLGEGYLNLVIETSVGNGKLFGFLSEHAEVTRKDYEENRVTIECRIPRRFVNVLTSDPLTEVRNLDGTPFRTPDEEDEEEAYSVNGR
jgi:GTP-binding protein HflX